MLTTLPRSLAKRREKGKKLEGNVNLKEKQKENKHVWESKNSKVEVKDIVLGRNNWLTEDPKPAGKTWNPEPRWRNKP